MVATYAVVYLLFTRSQASAASPGMREMWSRSFPPLDSIVGLGRWLAVVHSGDMMAYPCGGERGASALSLLACGVGAVVLWRRGRSVIVGCLLAPLGLAMVAAALRLYPYGGPAPHGSAARIMQYARPGLCLLIGVGAARLLETIRLRRPRDRRAPARLRGAGGGRGRPAGGGPGPSLPGLSGQGSPRFARRFWPEIGRGAEVACLRWDFGVAEWDSVRLGIAVSLCNEAIYSPSRRSGGPEVGRVSADRPLRCVLGVAPESEGRRSSPGSTSMAAQYDLRRRETIEVDTAEPGRRPSWSGTRSSSSCPARRAAQSVSGSIEFRAPALGDR